MSFARCEQETSYCRQLRHAIDAKVEVAERDPMLECWSFDKPYTNLNLKQCGTHRTRALELKICQGTSVRYSLFAVWHNLEMFAVPPKDRYCHYVAVPAFRQNLGIHCMLCVATPQYLRIIPAFLRQSSAAWSGTPWNTNDRVHYYVVFRFYLSFGVRCS